MLIEQHVTDDVDDAVGANPQRTSATEATSRSLGLSLRSDHLMASWNVRSLNQAG